MNLHWKFGSFSAEQREMDEAFLHFSSGSGSEDDPDEGHKRECAGRVLPDTASLLLLILLPFPGTYKIPASNK